jgi:hypothetical protein
MADVMWRETTVFGDSKAIEDPYIAYVLCGQRHALVDSRKAPEKLVADAAAKKLKLLKGARIERTVTNGVVKLSVYIPKEMHDVIKAAWVFGTSEAFRVRMEDTTKAAPSMTELKKLIEDGGLAAQRIVLDKWRAESKE